jgi:hypothetical protein
MIGAGLQLADGGACRLLRTADDLVRQGLDIGDAIAAAQIDQEFGCGLAAGDLGRKIAEDGTRAGAGIRTERAVAVPTTSARQAACVTRQSAHPCS